MTTYHTNCILTFDGAPKGQSQTFLDLRVPLEAGEAVCRAFFEAVGDTLYPTELNAMKGWANSKAKRKVTLVKVSMAASLPEGVTGEQADTNPALAWFNEGNGKLYFTP